MYVHQVRPACSRSCHRFRPRRPPTSSPAQPNPSRFPALGDTSSGSPRERGWGCPSRRPLTGRRTARGGSRRGRGAGTSRKWDSGGGSPRRHRRSSKPAFPTCAAACSSGAAEPATAPRALLLVPTANLPSQPDADARHLHTVHLPRSHAPTLPPTRRKKLYWDSGDSATEARYKLSSQSPGRGPICKAGSSSFW